MSETVRAAEALEEPCVCGHERVEHNENNGECYEWVDGVFDTFCACKKFVPRIPVTVEIRRKK